MKRLLLCLFILITANAAKGQSYGLSDTAYVDSLIGKAKAIHRTDPIAALDYCEQALAVAQQTKSEKYIGSSYNSIGIMNAMMGKTDTAMYYFEKAFEYLKNSTDYLRAYGIRLNMAEQYFEDGKIVTAFDYMRESMAVFDSANDTYGRTVCRMNLARAYGKLNNIALSRKLYKEAININNKRDTNLLIQLQVNLGASYLQNEQTDSAYLYINKAEKMAIAKKQYYDLISINLNLGDLHQINKEYEQAKNNYYKALSLNSNFGINHHTALANSRLCRLYLLTANYDSALYYANKAEALIEGLNDLLLQEEFYYDMHNLMDSMGDDKAAHQYLHKYIVAEDSIKSKEILETVEQYKYELSLSEKEKEVKKLEEIQADDKRVIRYQRIFGILTFIFLILFGLMAITISKRSRQHEHTNIELEKTNRVQNKMLATISHDLRAPLASLFSLVNLSNRNLLGEEESKNLYKTLEKKLSGTMVIVDNLLYWSKNQIAEIKPEIKTIDINQLIEKNIELYSNIAANKRVSLGVDLDEIKLVKADKTLLNLVVRNLLSNAIKYTKAKGKVTISTKANKGKITVTIKDTGVGLTEDVKKRLFTEEQFSQKGTNDETGTGLGLLISYEFIKMHNSLLKVESALGEGTRFYFDLKVDE